MMIEYTQKALELAEYRRLEDKSWFAEIPGFEGVWANAPTVEAARTELVEVPLRRVTVGDARSLTVLGRQENLRPANRSKLAGKEVPVERHR